MKIATALLALTLITLSTPQYAVARTKKPKSAPKEAAEAKPTPAPAVIATAHVRVWKPALAHHGELRLAWKPAGKGKTGIALEGGAAGNQFMESANVPAGAGVLEIYDSVDPAAKPVLTLNGEPTAGPSAIVLITETANGKDLKAEWVRIGTQASSEAELLVYNFVPALKECHITIGTTANLQVAAFGANAHLKGIKRAFSPLAVEGQDLAGKSFRWTSDVDFGKYPHVIVLIRQDNYGRVRPQLIIETDDTGDASKKG